MKDMVEEILDRFPGASRAERVDAALRSLTRATTEAHITVAELAWEVHTRAYWIMLVHADGTKYSSSLDYFQDALAIEPAERSAFYQRLRLGKAISRIDPGIRNWTRDQLATLGISKAIALAPVIGRLTGTNAAAIWHWIEHAEGVTASQLRCDVSEAIGATPRGVARSEPCPTCGRPLPRKKLAAGEASTGR